MLDIKITQPRSLQFATPGSRSEPSIQAKSQVEKVKLLIIRDLMRLGWEIDFGTDKVLITPPQSYDKRVIKQSMQIRRQEALIKNAAWLSAHQHLATANLANGDSAWCSEIEPVIEVCETQAQFDIFRYFRFYWSAPYSDYVGRRIKILIRDNALPDKPLIGLAALGSSIIHIPDRDKWIGWDTRTRTKNLIFAMDAYVLGALPPYNYLLGGKLISYIVASNEIRSIFEQKYKDKITNISKRTENSLACLFTTSLYGRSSQYNRIKYNGKLLYNPIGQTKGYGTLQLTDETFNAMRGLLKSRNVSVSNNFGDGPIWRMRVIRAAADVLGIDADFLLKHSFQRGIYVVPLADNFKEFLRDEDSSLRSCDYALVDLVHYWKKRWLNNRKLNSGVEKNVLGFQIDNFKIK